MHARDRTSGRLNTGVDRPRDQDRCLAEQSLPMIFSDIIEFLSQVPPFQFLNREVLKLIAGKITIEFYPKGSEILMQKGEPSQYLYVIKKGGVKLFVKSGSGEIIIDYRSEGDSFGFVSLYGGDRSKTNVVAIEDTICYLVDKETFFNLHESNPAFAEYFLRSYLGKYVDKTFSEMFDRRASLRTGSALPYTTLVSDVVSRKLITEAPITSIRHAAEIMVKHKISSLVIVNDAGSPTGIITDRDLREKVVASGESSERPVSEIMTTKLIAIDAMEYCFEALLSMIRNNIHHMLVTDNGQAIGILTNNDIMMLQGKSPLALAQEIEGRGSIEALTSIAAEIHNMIGFLLKEGAKASSIARIIAELNDILVKRIIEIQIAHLGEPPTGFCWIVYGSEGRMEQTFKTDQDNALIYADLGTEHETGAAAYFTELAQLTNQALVECGYPPCPAGYMASNPKWCQPLSAWRRFFTEWMTSSTPDAILLSTIFFDFRPVYGDFELAATLKTHLTQTLEKEGFFLARMGASLTDTRPPLGFFRTFVVEKDGEHKDMLNLKTSAIAPLVDIVRLFSLEKGIVQTSTLDRISALKGRHGTIDEFAEELEQSFEFMMVLRMLSQLEQNELGKEADNFINPKRLSTLEKHALKEIFQMISRIQDLIYQRYRLGTLS